MDHLKAFEHQPNSENQRFTLEALDYIFFLFFFFLGVIPGHHAPELYLITPMKMAFKF